MSGRKTFILTGAAGGLGSQVVRQFADRNVNLLCVDRDADNLRKVQESVQVDAEADIQTCVADVTQKADVQRYVQVAVDTWGGIDGAFHVAGWEGAMREFIDIDIDEFDTMMAVNARSVWYGMKFVLPELLKRGGGRIVNTGSYVAFHGTLRTSAYGAAKHAVVGMSRGVAREQAANNIAINVLAPGGMDTRMIRTVWDRHAPGDPERGRQIALANVPAKKIGDPADVAAVGIWLLTEAPVHLTGQIIPVDGGTSI